MAEAIVLLTHTLNFTALGACDICSGCQNRIPQTRCLNNRNYVLFEDWKCKSKVTAGLVSGETALLGLYRAISDPTWPFLSTHIPGDSFSTYKDASPGVPRRLS